MPMFKCNSTVQRTIPLGAGPVGEPWTVTQKKKKNSEKLL